MTIKLALLIPVLLAFGCGGVSMTRINDVDFNPNDFEVADMNQAAMRHSASLDEDEEVGQWAGLTSENGHASVLSDLEPGCYVAVATSQQVTADIDVGAFELDSEPVNANLARADSFRTSGMALRGFCVTGTDPVTVGVASSHLRMGVVLTVYRVRDADTFVRAVERLQETGRRSLANSLLEIIRGVDDGARQIEWPNAEFPDRFTAGQRVVSSLPPGVAAGACVAVVVSGSGGSARDVDLYVHTGERATPETVLGLDDRINPNAAVAFTVPQDPGTVRVAVVSYTGAGPIAFGLYSVNTALCGPGRPPIPIPGARN